MIIPLVFVCKLSLSLIFLVPPSDVLNECVICISADQKRLKMEMVILLSRLLIDYAKY